MIVNGPDGTPHDFPDDATNDEVLKFFGQGASPPAEQPSYASQLVGQLAKPLRAFNKGLTGGLWDPAVGGVKSLFGAGSPSQERIQTAAAEQQMGPGASIALEGAGAVAGPGKLMATENAARLAASPLTRLITRGVGGAAEGGAYSGINALANQKDTWDATGTGAAIGGVTSAGFPMVQGIVSHLAKKLPDSITGAVTPDIPTSAGMTDPRKYGGYSFISQADKDQAAKLADLEEMQRKSNVAGGPTLGAQTSAHLLNPDNVANLTDAEHAAINNVSQVAPNARMAVQHPNYVAHALGDVPGVLGVESVMHGEPLQAALGLGSGLAAHLGAYKIPPIMLRNAQQSAFDEAKRVIGGTPSTPSPVGDWINNPNINKSIQALILNQTMNQ
jgi:hypothetical protein